MMDSFHIPVLLKEVLHYLIPKKGGGVYIDCTLGGGGHSKAILERIYPDGLLIGIDRDIEAIKAARKELSNFLDRAILIRDNFKNLEEILSNLKIKVIAGVLFDLGVSSHQLRERERGFSFREDGHLDMRMDPTQKFNASTLINNYTEEELVRIFGKYGEERFSKRIARLIVLERQKNPITTTKQLADLVIRALPKAKKRGRWRIHPATRVFQAIRIEVNQELDLLEKSLNQVIKVLEDKGRICVISYHSLEDRIVKNVFKKAEREKVAKENYGLKIITKKPIRASQEEIKRNPKARSAKLRVAEKAIIH
ncbi:MAG TPA: 16S rRNA (cytosine(1402)-N(4))-methyltransferase RsmH [Candidatus Atribacteria bacterium]|nr:16S rRNA (cytosine(1402)-N(4))-methyltransferase RsmH [Candidatus Atribacteria bacterium]